MRKISILLVLFLFMGTSIALPSVYAYTPVLEQIVPIPKTYPANDPSGFYQMAYSGSGDVTAGIQAVDLTTSGGSTSGCEAADFTGFTPGNIALLQRGTCTYALKAQNAQAAGAVGVIIFNEGNTPDRTEAMRGTLGGPGIAIPVVGTSFAIGEELYNLSQTQNVTVRMYVLAATVWTIDKIADQSELTLLTGQTFPVNYSVTVDIEYEGEVDYCIDITDTDEGPLGIVCKEDTPMTFTYSRNIGPYDVCGKYIVNNIVSFETDDTGYTGADFWPLNVHVPCPPICRSAGFWGTHAGTECPKKKPNCGSQNITQAVINECNSCLDICGEIITNTGLNNANSAIEAICVRPTSNSRLQLARQLSASSLNCCLSDGEGDCKGLSDWDNVFNFCNSACALNLSDSFDFCIKALDCLNSGGKVIELMGDTEDVACQSGTCQPSADNDIPCGKNLPSCSVGSCVPFQETCYTKDLCNEDLGLCFNSNGPAGSSDACTLATGDGKGKNASNYCAILPMLNPPEANCSKFNQGEECCGSDVEQSCKACEHSLCEIGIGLDPFCDPCVTAVCFEHPECCGTEMDGWNISCIAEAITICDISCNTIGWANLQWPPVMTHTISAINRTENAYGQVWIDGVTNQPGQTPGLRAQLGYGPVGSDPDGNPSWVWVDASFNVDAGNNDEFVASMLPDIVGQFDYLYRYSTTDGLFWLYADLNGPITAGTLPPNPGKLTVNSSGDTTPPASPSNLIVASVSENSVELAWDAVVDDPTMYGYEVLRSDVSGGPYSIVALVAGTTDYIDMSVETGQTYFYVLRAVDLSFNRSAISNEVQATPEVRTVTVTFNVTVPATTDGTGKSVYIAGFLERLNGNLPQWNPGGVVLTRVDATHWTITLTGNEGTSIEYKYAMGDWDYVEKDSTCGETTNRQLTLSYGSNGVQTVNDTVLNWRNVSPCGI